MEFHRSGRVGLFAAVSYALVLLSGKAALAYSDEGLSLGCNDLYIADGVCDLLNNNEECGYDGGDCCECTCISPTEYTCGEDQEFGGFECRDPKSLCSEDDDDNGIDIHDDDDSAFDDENDHAMGSYSYDVSTSYSYDMPASFSYSWCLDMFIGDGDCDADNNNEECDYDGGDCCECDCTSNSISTCGFYNAFDCIDPTSACVNGYVEAGTKTAVTVSANAYDTRPGEDSGDNGCGVDGCTPGLTRDGVSVDVESRWSCAQEIVPDGGYCEIEFVFEDPQDIVEVQVAFWKGDERSRTLEATVNGEVVGSFSSYPGSTFNALGIQESGVNTLALTSIGIEEEEWTSLIEVRFLVEQ